MRIAQSGKNFSSSLNHVTTKIGISVLAGMSALSSSLAWAAPSEIQNGADNAAPTGASTDLPALFKMISNTLIYIVGAVAVVMLIIGGLRYVISNGDPKAVEAAKNTILYAIIGIIVAILSFAIVNFVISKF